MKGYSQFCPVAKAAEIITMRWTPLVLRELMCGGKRFSDLRRGLRQMSPSLLSKRLKELEHHGIVERLTVEGETAGHYTLTESGHQLRPVIEALGAWGHRWSRSQVGDEDLDAGLLMWDMRRRLSCNGLPVKRLVVHFEMMDAPAAQRRWWLVFDDEVDLCLQNPGYDVDVEVTSDLRTMVDVWLGHTDTRAALRSQTMELTGNRANVRAFKSMFKSPFVPTAAHA